MRGFSALNDITDRFIWNLLQKPRQIDVSAAAVEVKQHGAAIHGAGQQQWRSVWANMAADHRIRWMHTLVELWTWTPSHHSLRDGSDSPWDDLGRRPSHAARLNALRRTCWDRQFSAILPVAAISRRIRRFIKRLVNLAISV